MKIVIIGAGVAGLGIGWRLAKAGASVTVLERAQVGNGATSASGGMVASAVEVGVAQSPETALAAKANGLWPGFAAELEAESKIAVGYRRSGALIVPMGGVETDPQHSLGIVEHLDSGEARLFEPLLGDTIRGAILVPQEAMVDSQSMCRALAVALVRAGGQVLSNQTAVRFEMQGGRVTGVATQFAVHQADAFLITAGSWSGRFEGLPPGALPPITPVKGEMAVLAAPQGFALPEHVIWGNGIYAVPRQDKLLIGATMELAGFDTTLSQRALRWLFRQSTGLMPGLKTWRLAGHWAGLRPSTPDRLPALGKTAVDGLYVASGQFRNGILFAPAIAESVSRLILEQVPIPSAFDPRRFEAGGPGLSLVETPHRDVPDEAGIWRTGF